MVGRAVRAAVDAAEQQVRGHEADLGRFLGDHRHAGPQHVGEREVVEADERDVILAAELLQGPAGPDGEQVLRGEQRGRRVGGGEQVAGRPLGGLDAVQVAPDEPVVDRVGGVRVTVAGVAFPGGPDGADVAEEPDAAVAELAQPPQYLLVDTAAGLSDNVSMLAAAADDVVLVVCDEPASLTDAYALTKVLSRDFGVRRFRMVANMTQNEGEARQLHRKLSRVSDRFLDVVIDFAGWVPHDERLRQAIRRQSAVVDLWPSSRSALAFKKLAGVVDTWAEPERAGRDRIAFFGGRATPAAGC